MNKKQKQVKKTLDFQDYLREQLKNPEIKKYYIKYGKQLEVAYEILELRKKEGLSQAEFAKRIGTRQSNVARMEAGGQNFTTEMLNKIALTFKHELRIEFVK